MDANKKKEMLAFLEEKINTYAKRIVERNDKGDDVCYGQLTFYMAYRRHLNGEATMADRGVMDALADTLIQLGLITNEQKSFFK